MDATEWRIYWMDISSDFHLLMEISFQVIDINLVREKRQLCLDVLVYDIYFAIKP